MRTLALLTIGAVAGASLAAMLIRRRIEIIERIVEHRAPINAQTLRDVQKLKDALYLDEWLKRQHQVDLDMGVSPLELWEEEQAAIDESNDWAERMIEEAKAKGLLP